MAGGKGWKVLSGGEARRLDVLITLYNKQLPDSDYISGVRAPKNYSGSDSTYANKMKSFLV